MKDESTHKMPPRLFGLTPEGVETDYYVRRDLYDAMANRVEELLDERHELRQQVDAYKRQIDKLRLSNRAHTEAGEQLIKERDAALRELNASREAARARRRWF